MDGGRKGQVISLPDDETVCFRHHKDGSLTVIGLDGVIRCHITKEQFQGMSADVDDGLAFFRGAM